MDEPIRLRLEMTQDDLAVEQQRADKHLSVESVSPMEPSSEALEEARFIETVVVIAAVTVGLIAKRIVDDWLKNKEQGLQIDTRTVPPTISMLANVPRGFLVLIGKDGSAEVHKAEYEKGEDLAPLLAQYLTQG
jgi:hypothetical protein